MAARSPRDLVRLWPRVRPHRGALALAFVALVGSAAIGLAFPLVVKYLLDAAFVEGSRAALDRIALLLLGLFAIQAIFNYVQAYLLSATGERAVAGLRHDVFSRLLEMPPGFFADRRTGELTSRLTTDIGLLQGVLTVNEEQFERTTEKIVDMAGGSVDGVTVAVWGLTFKANTDDRRDSPSLEIISRLIARGARVQAFDPTVTADATDEGGMVVCADPYAACDNASVLAVLTEWDEFKWLDLDKVASLMATPRVVDARNLLDRSALLRRGFTYRAIGRS